MLCLLLAILSEDRILSVENIQPKMFCSFHIWHFRDVVARNNVWWNYSEDSGMVSGGHTKIKIRLFWSLLHLVCLLPFIHLSLCLCFLPILLPLVNIAQLYWVNSNTSELSVSGPLKSMYVLAWLEFKYIHK